MSKRQKHIQVYPDRRKRFRFRVVAANGEITTVGQSYASRQGGRRAARREYPTLPVVSVAK